MNNKEILSEMGRLWKEVSQEDKKVDGTREG
jgi:hypothetical protein